MAVGLKVPDFVSPINGVRLAAVSAGIKNNNADLVLVEMAEGSSIAATFTQNQFCAAPVTVAKTHLQQTQSRYLLINSGNANAGTGDEGIHDAEACCETVAESLGCERQQVLPFSTGVIGQALPVTKVQNAIPLLAAQLDENNWKAAAEAIMTTDTLPKVVSKTINILDQDITITGMSKGAGMICPNMATMLGYIATDAEIAVDLLEEIHTELVDETFNRITVDGDTSTNDACVLIATGQSRVIIERTNEVFNSFKAALLDVYQLLAQAIIRDAEGATKFVEINVKNAATSEDSNAIAYTIAHSPLVKTALYASDANWGRIIAAVGRAGVKLDINNVKLIINGLSIFSNGKPDPAYTEEQGMSIMQSVEINIDLDLGMGASCTSVWTSDLNHDYVSINADYRT